MFKEVLLCDNTFIVLLANSLNYLMPYHNLFFCIENCSGSTILLAPSM